MHTSAGHRSLYLVVAVFGFLGMLAWAPDAHAAFSRAPEVKLYEGSEPIESFNAYDPQFAGGVQIVMSDFGNDGIDELVTAPGVGGGPHVRVLRADGSEIDSFLAYDALMRAGVNVAVGDLDGDGKKEIITAPRQGGAPHVRIFTREGLPIFTPGFMAYDENFRGGVSVAVADVNGDGLDEIITGAGKGGGPQVRVFDRYGEPLFSFFAFHGDFRGGINVATAALGQDKSNAIIAAVLGGDQPLVKVFSISTGLRTVSQFLAFGKNFIGGVGVSGADVDGDGVDEIVTAAGHGGGPQVRVFTINGELLPLNFFSYENDFRGGVNVAAGDTNGDGIDEITTAPAAIKVNGVNTPKQVIVDLSEQRLYAYEHGMLVKTFLISSGLPGYDTPTGSFHISQKIYSKLYSGPTYYFPNTLWNMRFDGPRLLHGAYWHNSFGKRKSHGCVNISYPNAAWLYSWAPIGTSVIVQA